MATPNTKNLVESNKVYASTYTKGDLAMPPAKQYTVVTCMDARIDPAAAFGIELGDAHVIRNAGGSAQDALRNLVISQQLLGTKEILVIKHTKCGMLTFEDHQAAELVRKNLGEEGVKAVADGFGGQFLAYSDTEAKVKEDVEWLEKNKAIPEDIKISGWVYELETGKVRSVV